MARYKPYDLNQAKMIPLSYADHVVEGSFEHALNEVSELASAEEPLTPLALATIVFEYLAHGPPREPLEVEVLVN